MAGTSADVREADLAQDLAHGTFVIDHAKPLGDETLEVHAPPAHNPVHHPIRASLNDLGQFCLLVRGEAWPVALRPGVGQPIWAALVEAVNPVAQGLAVHAADARGLGPAHPIQDRGQRQQAPALAGVLGCGRKPTKLTGREIRPYSDRCWHDEGPPGTIQSAQPTSRKPRKSHAKALGISP